MVSCSLILLVGVGIYFWLFRSPDTAPPTAIHKVQARSWMSNLDDSTLLSSLSIPGSHNSASYGSSEFFVCCQDWTVKEQLDAGVRFLDLRVNPMKNQFQLQHGSVSLKRSLGPILKEIESFLSEQPTEAVIIHVMRQGKAGKGADTSRSLWRRYRQKHPALFCPFHPETELGEARGKVLLMVAMHGQERGNISIENRRGAPPWPFLNYADHFSLNQNYAKVKSKLGVSFLHGKVLTMDEKQDKVIQTYEAASITSGWVMNWWSGSTGILPRTLSDTINTDTAAALSSYLTDKNGKRVKKKLGINAMDFIHEGAVSEIIKSNFSE